MLRHKAAAEYCPVIEAYDRNMDADEGISVAGTQSTISLGGSSRTSGATGYSEDSGIGGGFHQERMDPLASA